MKKVFLSLLAVLLFTTTYAQKGDLYVGAQGGYITHFKDLVYGLNVSYHLADPLEISLTGLMNPSIKEAGDNLIDPSTIKMYSANLDFRYYMLLQRTWGMGPSLGGQYLFLDKKYDNSVGEEYKVNAFGFNIGWHMRANITENIKLTGGWRYTTANHDASHHLFYASIGYTFNTY